MFHGRLKCLEPAQRADQYSTLAQTMRNFTKAEPIQLGFVETQYSGDAITVLRVPCQKSKNCRSHADTAVLRSRQAVVLVQPITIFSPTDKVKAVCLYVAKLSRRLKDRFVLVGGAAMLFLRSQQITKDVDNYLCSRQRRRFVDPRAKMFYGTQSQNRHRDGKSLSVA
ncbi:hypothetical protein FQN53_007106 [Emmonsiellopsis sp. PD_33]|nr:hypothetical protein FQN53_007106 [Emmonsiellopsis sp. PD_33]